MGTREFDSWKALSRVEAYERELAAVKAEAMRKAKG